MSDAGDGYDWKGVSVSLAADNARMCGIIIASDELAREVELLLEAMTRGSYVSFRRDILQRALDAYKIVRSGQ